MRMLVKKRILLVLILGLILGACTMSGTPDNGPDDGAPTPNLTLTEWFKPTGGSAPADPTATMPADEPAEPTATLPPTEPTHGIPVEPEEEGEDPGPEPTNAPIILPTPNLNPIDLGGVGVELTVGYLDDAPTIDGDISDWDAPAYALNQIVYGEEFYADYRDLSGAFKIGWDTEYLYLGVLVMDTRFVQAASGNQLYLGDSLEVLLDVDLAGDEDDAALSSDDFQLGFSPGNLYESTAPEAFLWAPTSQAAPMAGVMIAAGFTEEGYVMEVALPWDAVGVTPADGLVMRFQLSVSDNDAISANEQHSVVSFNSERKLHDPTSWPTIELEIE